jgi:hypothetical protein
MISLMQTNGFLVVSVNCNLFIVTNYSCKLILFFFSSVRVLKNNFFSCGWGKMNIHNNCESQQGEITSPTLVASQMCLPTKYNIGLQDARQMNQ